MVGQANHDREITGMNQPFQLLVCVSHDRDLPGELVDREVELVDGRIAYDGPGREDDRDIARGNLS